MRSIKDIESLPDVPCIAEELIPFKNELAVIVARNPEGEIKTYPVVEMEFHPEANQVEYVICPARIENSVATKAQEIARKKAEEQAREGWAGGGGREVGVEWGRGVRGGSGGQRRMRATTVRFV